MSVRVTFAVVDDHPMVRRVIVETLRDQRDFEVVADGATADEALQIAALHQPDLIFLDVNMPGGGVSAAARINAAHPRIRTVMFSFRQDTEIVRASLAAGASGYLVKGVSGGELIDAIRRILAGEIYVSPGLREQLDRD